MWRESPSAFESHREPENMNRVCVCMRINHNPSSGIKPVTFISLIWYDPLHAHLRHLLLRKRRSATLQSKHWVYSILEMSFCDNVNMCQWSSRSGEAGQWLMVFWQLDLYPAVTVTLYSHWLTAHYLRLVLLINQLVPINSLHSYTFTSFMHR